MPVTVVHQSAITVVKHRRRSSFLSRHCHGEINASMLESRISLPSIHRRAIAGRATVHVVTTCLACTTAPASTGRASRFLPWVVPLSLGLRSKAAHYYSSVFPFSRILFHFKISRNLFKVPKFIENRIKLRKYKTNFLVVLLSRSLQ
jgi:hypothetical protein